MLSWNIERQLTYEEKRLSPSILWFGDFFTLELFPQNPHSLICFPLVLYLSVDGKIKTMQRTGSQGNRGQLLSNWRLTFRVEQFPAIVQWSPFLPLLRISRLQCTKYICIPLWFVFNFSIISTGSAQSLCELTRQVKTLQSQNSNQISHKLWKCLEACLVQKILC